MEFNLLDTSSRQRLREEISNRLKGVKRTQETLTRVLFALHFLDEENYDSFDRRQLALFVDEMRMSLEENSNDKNEFAKSLLFELDGLVHINDILTKLLKALHYLDEKVIAQRDRMEIAEFIEELRLILKAIPNNEVE